MKKVYLLLFYLGWVCCGVVRKQTLDCYPERLYLSLLEYLQELNKL